MNCLLLKRNLSSAAKRQTNGWLYCMENVKKFDYENYLASLLLHGHGREAAFALRSFNIEIAQATDVASQEIIAQMRLQFWRDAIDNIYKNKPPEQPIAKALAMVVERHNPPKRWFINLIESRTSNIGKKSFTELAEIEDYAEQANSSLYYILLHCQGIKDVNADHAASHLGKCEGIVKILRGIPHFAQNNKVFIPSSLLVLHKVTQEDIIRGSREKKVKDLIYDVASNAHHHVQMAKDLKSKLPRKTYEVLLPVVAMSKYLERLQLCDFDIFDARLQQRHHSLPMHLAWAKLRKTYF